MLYHYEARRQETPTHDTHHYMNIMKVIASTATLRVDCIERHRLSITPHFVHTNDYIQEHTRSMYVRTLGGIYVPSELGSCVKVEVDVLGFRP